VARPAAPPDPAVNGDDVVPTATRLCFPEADVGRASAVPEADVGGVGVRRDSGVVHGNGTTSG
jgi:hypothetical protein